MGFRSRAVDGRCWQTQRSGLDQANHGTCCFLIARRASLGSQGGMAVHAGGTNGYLEPATVCLLALRRAHIGTGWHRSTNILFD